MLLADAGQPLEAAISTMAGNKASVSSSRMFAMSSVSLLALLGTLAGGIAIAKAGELPSILQAGETFCTSEADFDDFASHGAQRSNSGTETCTRIDRPVRVAVLNGRGGVKTEVRLSNGPMAYSIGWTNGRLPVAR